MSVDRPKCASRRIHSIGAALVAAAVILWLGTGAEGYTRWPNQRLASADALPAAGEGDLLAEVGFADAPQSPARADIQSRFALGLVPGGVDPLHLLSVATVVAAALVASTTAVAIAARRRACSSPASRTLVSGSPSR